jgi:hypothetical protein
MLWLALQVSYVVLMIPDLCAPCIFLRRIIYWFGFFGSLPISGPISRNNSTQESQMAL